MAEYYRNAWYAQLQKKVAELEEEIRKAIELPEVTAEDDGKVLMVDSEGKWDAEDVPKELPTVTSADEGKVLTVDSEGEYVVEQPTKELPTVTSADEGKVLTVDSNGDWYASNVLNGNNYSTAEQVVGTWVDGRPLYQKTVQIENPTVGLINWYNHGIQDIDYIVMFFSHIIQSDVGGNTAYNRFHPLTSYTERTSVDGPYAISVDGITNTSIRVMVGNLFPINTTSIYVTIQYVKVVQ